MHKTGLSWLVEEIDKDQDVQVITNNTAALAKASCWWWRGGNCFSDTLLGTSYQFDINKY